MQPATQGNKNQPSPVATGEKTTETAARKPTFTLVENTTAQTFGLGLKAPKQADGQVQQGVNATEPKVKLIPGINKVLTEDWEAAKENKMVQIHLKGDKRNPIAKFKVHDGCETLADLDENDALALIVKCHDREMLKEWLETDKRPGVQEALKTQVDLFERTMQGGRNQNELRV